MRIFRPFFYISLGFFLLLVLPAVLQAQLIVDDQVPLEQIIQRLAGRGVEISAVRSNCDYSGQPAYGFFQDSSFSLDVESGLLMTTGAANLAIGPNNQSDEFQANVDGEQISPLLQPLVEGNRELYDICEITFEVTVYNDSLLFNYVFGSEEYPEFVAEYHDVFGFFVSGPGLPGWQNVATLPGRFGSEPISVSTVNADKNTRYFVDNGTGSTPLINLFIQYDGYTRKLEAKIKTEPCSTYTLKFLIGDVKDNLFDSGVFIESGSIRSNAPRIEVDYEFPELG